MKIFDKYNLSLENQDILRLGGDPIHYIIGITNIVLNIAGYNISKKL